MGGGGSTSKAYLGKMHFLTSVSIGLRTKNQVCAKWISKKDVFVKHPAVYSLSSCIHLRSQLAQPADGDAHAQNLLPLGLHPFPSAALASLHYFHESSLHSKKIDNIPIFHISTFWPFPNWKPPSEALKKFSQTLRAAQLSYLVTSIKKTTYEHLGDNLGTTCGQPGDYWPREQHSWTQPAS